MVDPHGTHQSTSPFPSIDVWFYPHIFDQIFEDAPHNALVRLRQTCQELKERVDAHLGEHIVLWERTQLPQGICALNGGQLPLLHGCGTDLSFLSATRVLDIPGASNAVAFDKVIRSVRKLDFVRTYDRTAQLSPSMRNVEAETYVRFLNLLPTDRHPCIPIGCRKVVLNIDHSRYGNGDKVVIDFAQITRGIKELVVVLNNPPARLEVSDADGVNNITSLGKSIGCHPWLVYQLLSLARYLPRRIGKLTFVNMIPASSPEVLTDAEAMIYRILSGRSRFADLLQNDTDPAPLPEERQAALEQVSFVSLDEYAARLDPKTFLLETDSSAFRNYARQVEETRGTELARL